MNQIDIIHLSDLDIWSMVVGFLLPPLIAVILRSHWRPEVKAAVTVGVCLIGGGVTAYLMGYFHGVTLVRAILLTLGAALFFYRVFWKPSQIAPGIEAATTPDPGRPWFEVIGPRS
jgi:L-lactate permease